MNIAPSGGNERMPTVQRSDAEMIRARDERKPLVFTLTNASEIEGSIRWFDDNAVCVVNDDRDEITIYKHSILYFKAK